MEFLKIVLLSVAAACGYGVVHDQVTARICIEYFTIGHVRVIDSESPTLLALVWGVIATWWMGLLLGVPLAAAARIGKRNRITANRLVRPVAIGVGGMALASLVSGIIGRALAIRGDVHLIGWLAERVPETSHVAFLTCLWAHSASYAAGVLIGVVLLIWTLRQRLRRSPSTEAAPPSPP